MKGYISVCRPDGIKMLIAVSAIAAIWENDGNYNPKCKTVVCYGLANIAVSDTFEEITTAIKGAQ